MASQNNNMFDNLIENIKSLLTLQESINEEFGNLIANTKIQEKSEENIEKTKMIHTLTIKNVKESTKINDKVIQLRNKIGLNITIGDLKEYCKIQGQLHERPNIYRGEPTINNVDICDIKNITL